MILDDIRNRDSETSPSQLIDAIDHGARVVDAVLAALALFAREHDAEAPEVYVDPQSMLELSQLGREVVDAMAANANRLFDLQRKAAAEVDPSRRGAA